MLYEKKGDIINSDRDLPSDKSMSHLFVREVLTQEKTYLMSDNYILMLVNEY